MVIVTEKYHNLKGCCDTSLFEKSQSLPDTAKSSHHLNDHGYFKNFPLEWKYTGGFEAPMCFYFYGELQVKWESEFESLPAHQDKSFLDWFPHYPYSEKHNLFVAMTRKRSGSVWNYFIEFFRHTDSWSQIAYLANEDVGRPLQFTTDGDGFLLLQNHKILRVDLSDFSTSIVFDAESRSLQNAHISKCERYIGAVTTKGQDADTLEFSLIGEEKTIGPFCKGENPEFSLSDSVTVPLRVGNGMSEISFEPGN